MSEETMMTGGLLSFPLLLLAGAAAALAQAGDRPAVGLEPFLPTQWLPAEPVKVTTVQNHYGQCGTSVVHVLGVRNQHDGYFTVDDNVGARLLIMYLGRSLDLADALSDHNGVACLANGPQRYLLVWSRCAGSACSDRFSFTVVDAERIRIVAGADGSCDEQCASRITGSRLPIELNRRERR